MANQTVYPYGTGGSLPSSIGLVNDLVTGGADNALAAEQGKIIGEKINGGEQIILSDDLTKNTYGIKTDGTFQAGTHVAIPVTPGEEVTVTTISTTRSGGACCFATVSYESTHTSGGTVWLAEAATFWMNANQSVVKTVPREAKYLLLCTSTNQYATKYSVKKSVPSTVFTRTEGEEIQSVLFPEYSPVNLTEGTTASFYPNSSVTPRVWQTNGSHRTIPVIPGEELRISQLANNAQNGAWYFFVDDSYESSLQSGSVIPLVGDLKWVTDDATEGYLVTVPVGAAYLCLCYRSGIATYWAVDKKHVVDSDLLVKGDIVDNLIQGGTDKPLSAEQGKLLASAVYYDITSSLTSHTYVGAPVKIEEEHKVACEVVAKVTSIIPQGGACFGDYLFMFAANNTTCWIYNLAENALLQTITIPEEERGFVANCHCNTVNFGTEYYDTNDPFPLIYVSTGYASVDDTGALVYRIIATTTTENDVETTTYSLSLVQTLKMPGTGWTEFVTGENGFCYLCYTTPRIIYKMSMPKLSEGDITFDLESALSIYRFSQQPSWFNGSRNQNRFYHNGKIYMVSGVPAATPTATSERSLFIALDLASETRETIINLQDLGLNSEPETCFIWKGHICIFFRSNTAVYALRFA